MNAVDLNTFIRLFVNHRPVYGIGKNNIQEAFASLLRDDKDGGTISKGILLFYNLNLYIEELLNLL